MTGTERMAGPKIEYRTEVDYEVGKPVYHCSPKNQPHYPSVACSCRPVLWDIKEVSAGVFQEIWRHWREAPQTTERR